MVKLWKISVVGLTIAFSMFLLMNLACTKGTEKEEAEKGIEAEPEVAAEQPSDTTGEVSGPDVTMLIEFPEAIAAKEKAAHRSQEAISKVVLDNKDQIQYCYWTCKRQDTTLAGQVKVEFTINPAGKVTNVLFVKSKWGGNPLKDEVEKQIKKAIMQWRFEAIDTTKGDVTAGATFIFQ